MHAKIETVQAKVKESQNRSRTTESTVCFILEHLVTTTLNLDLTVIPTNRVLGRS